MDWNIVEPQDLSSFGARARLQSRAIMNSHYKIPLEQILRYFDDTLRNSRHADASLSFELVIVSSNDRACACIPSNSIHTIVLDLGFLELVADFAMVIGGYGNHFPVNRAQFERLSPAETIWPVDADRQAFKRSVERDHFGFEDYDPEPWDELGESTEDLADDPLQLSDDDEVYDNPDASEDLTITGSQIFRDVARKLSDSLPHVVLRKDVFDAFMAWPVHDRGTSFPASCVLFNHLVTGENEFDEEQAFRADFFLRHIVTGANLVLLHEVAHSLFPDELQSQWLSSNDSRRIAKFLEALLDRQAPDSYFRMLIERLASGLTSASAENPRVRRAVYESFYDMRAIDIFLDAHIDLQDPKGVSQFLALVLQICSTNIALLVFKEHLIDAIQEPQRMRTAGLEAYDETVKRLIMLFAYFKTLLAETWPEADEQPLNAQFQNSVEDVGQLHKFFSIDMLNGLPIFCENGQDFHQAAADFWVRFMDVVSTSQA